MAKTYEYKFLSIDTGEAALNSYGKNGWDMVGCKVRSGNTYEYIMKREHDDSPQQQQQAAPVPPQKDAQKTYAKPPKDWGIGF